MKSRSWNYDYGHDEINHVVKSWWSWNQDNEIMVMKSRSWNHGHGDEIMVINQGHEIMVMKSRSWNHGHGIMVMKSWWWNHGHEIKVMKSWNHGHKSWSWSWNQGIVMKSRSCNGTSVNKKNKKLMMHIPGLCGKDLKMNKKYLSTIIY